MKLLSTRLVSGTDLRQGIEDFAKQNDVRAGAIVSCVGGLEKARLRMAGAKEIKEYAGPLEITSTTGTIAVENSHIHLTVSDAEGTVVGGHLSPGCVIRLTAEIVIIEDESKEFTRSQDESTGFAELVIKDR